MKKLIAGCFIMHSMMLLLFSNASFAGEEVGKIRFQHGQYGSHAESSGKMFFYLDGGTKQSTPTCATYDSGERWAIDNNRPAAHIQLSILLAAYMANQDVKVRGSGSCDVHGDSETAIDIIPN